MRQDFILTGKLTRCHPVAAALAVAAARLNRPVRMQLHRQEDMLFVGIKRVV